MKKDDTGRHIDTLDQSTDILQIHIIVDDCRIKLNFPPESENAVISDVKRMMLCGVNR